MLLKAISFLFGFLTGYQLGPMIYRIDAVANLFGWGLTQDAAETVFAISGGLIFGIIFLIIIPAISKRVGVESNKLVKKLKTVSLAQLLMYVGALIISLVLAALFSSPIYKLQIPTVLQIIIVTAIYAAMVYLGLLVVHLKHFDIEAMFKNLNTKEGREESRSKFGRKNTTAIPKVLDTSVIIDGRIFDILKTGFVEGPIVIPTFVLDELQFIADSSDGLKRNRGRRGLDILNKIQKELPIEVQISEKNYNDISEVDSKLLRLARDIKGKVVTNDYNLNKVAEFQGVDVLNTNDLSNAVKAVVLPGEEMSVLVIKEGKESNQGVAYLEDGTMIVVEGGKHLIGKTIHVIVTSVLQTSAGRMIFAKPTHS
jgi:uncharacterized protein YacL